MKINSELGYQPVTYSELTQDDEFWKGCRSCINHDILMSKERKNCLCTAMLCDPSSKSNTKWFDFTKKSKVVERLLKMKQNLFMKLIKTKNNKIYSNEK